MSSGQKSRQFARAHSLPVEDPGSVGAGTSRAVCGCLILFLSHPPPLIKGILSDFNMAAKEKMPFSFN